MTLAVSPWTRSNARSSNATKRPLAEILGWFARPLPLAPLMLTDTSVVVPATRSRTNTSPVPFVSPETRSLASETKAMSRPSSEIVGSVLGPFPGSPDVLREMTLVVPSCRSRTNTSRWLFVSFGARFVASDSKTTNRPSAETPPESTASVDAPLPCAAEELMDTRLVTAPESADARDPPAGSAAS